MRRAVNILIHNCFAHPLMGLLEIFGLLREAAWLHDVTLPAWAIVERATSADTRRGSGG